MRVPPLYGESGERVNVRSPRSIWRGEARKVKVKVEVNLGKQRGPGKNQNTLSHGD